MIDRKTDYAIRTLLFLAREGGKSYRPSSYLGKKLGISPVFLSKILQQLSRKKVVSIGRGRRGGVILKGGDVSIFRVIRMFDPGFSLGRCLDPKFRCPLKRTCPMHRLLRSLDGELMAKLDSISVSKLAKRGGERNDA